MNKYEMNLPPHNSTAERKIISCLLFDPKLLDSIGDLASEEFYQLSHGKIYKAIIDGYKSGMTVSDLNVKLSNSKEYLSITDEIPTTKQFDKYVKQVRQTAQLRKAIATLRESAELIQDNTELQYDDLADRVINDVVSSLGSFRSDETCYPIADVMQESLDRVLSIHSGNSDPNVRKTGLIDVDNILGGLWPSDLVVVAGRPAMGKSAFGLTVGLQVAREEQKPVVLFTLEMSRQQEANRVIALETEINSEHLLRGNVAASGLDLIDRAVQTYRSIPLEVDDASSTTVGYIRSKSMQIKRKYVSLGLIVVDYLQLMRSTSKASREQQISDISRSLKGLAKSIGVPVIALSQLSRACEARPNKRPQLSDLRECVSVDQWIYTPHGPLMLRDKPTEVIAATRDYCGVFASTYVPKKYNHIYQICTQFGDLKATARHLILTGTGYKQVRDLIPGRDVIASPRQIPCLGTYVPNGCLLGWLVGNGSLSGTPGLIYRRELHQDVTKEIEGFGVRVNLRKNQKSNNVFDTYLSNGTESGSILNPLMSWIRSLQLEGCTAHTKYIPRKYLEASYMTHVELLRGLWESDGTVTIGTAKYSTVSELLARQVSWLLLTIGVRSNVAKETGNIYTVRVSNTDNYKMMKVVNRTDTDPIRFGKLSLPDERYIDPSPSIFVELASELCDRNVRRFQRKKDGSFKSVSKKDMVRVINHTPGLLSSIERSPYIQLKGMGWGRLYDVKKIEGFHNIADLSVPGPNNFIVNGIVAHNSGAIEQDADKVVFLYRDDYYNEESKEPGTAEVIVAKNRIGRTGTAKVIFDRELTRFRNMEKGRYDQLSTTPKERDDYGEHWTAKY